MYAIRSYYALVFSSLLRHELVVAQLGRFFLFMLLYTAVMTVIALLVGRSCKYAGKDGRALVLTTAMMNIGNFGLSYNFV